MTFFEINHKELVQILLSLASDSCQASRLDEKIHYNQMIITKILQRMFQLPQIQFPLIHFAALLTEFCAQDLATNMPILGRIIQVVWDNLEYIDIEIIDRFHQWFCCTFK